MTLHTRTILTLAAVLTFALPTLAAAESFTVLLAGRAVGTLTWDRDGPTLVSVLDNMPLGVGDGRFTGTSRAVHSQAGDPVTQYIGASDERTIAVVLGGGRALETTISPTSEMTGLSDAGRVPPGVLDPVAGFGRLMTVKGCPGAMRLYDGRRVAEVATLTSTAAPDTLTCRLDYRVVAGPGHLSPFRFTSLAITLAYSTSGTQSLRRATIGTGLFTITLSR